MRSCSERADARGRPGTSTATHGSSSTSRAATRSSILEGEVETIEVTDEIADAFQSKYDWRPDLGPADSTRWYELRPRRAQAWLERDYPKSATRFDF
jgi:hypothetical protein